MMEREARTRPFSPRLGLPSLQSQKPVPCSYNRALHVAAADCSLFAGIAAEVRSLQLFSAQLSQFGKGCPALEWTACEAQRQGYSATPCGTLDAPWLFITITTPVPSPIDGTFFVLSLTLLASATRPLWRLF